MFLQVSIYIHIIKYIHNYKYIYIYMHTGPISPSWLALHSPGTSSLFSYQGRVPVNKGIMRDMGQMG